MVFIFLTTGFEEVEALASIDILRRAGINIQSVSLTEKLQVVGGHQIEVTADCLFEKADFSVARMLIIPGGTVLYNEHQGLKDIVATFAQQDKLLAAICAAPMVFGGLGLLKNKQATCYPSFEKYLTGAILKTDEAVVVDGKIITGRGPGLVFDFALQLVEILEGKTKRDEVAKGFLVKL